MGWDGSGVYTRTNGDNTGGKLWAQDKADGDKITATRHDTHDEDIATAINNCLAKDGQNAMTGDLDLGGQDIINVGSSNATIIPPVTGTFIPTARSSGGSYTYTVQSGDYVQIGDFISFNIRLYAAVVGTHSLNFEIEGLPASAAGFGAVTISEITSGITYTDQLYARVETGSSRVYFYHDDTNTAVPMSAVTSIGILVGGSYLAA